MNTRNSPAAGTSPNKDKIIDHHGSERIAKLKERITQMQVHLTNDEKNTNENILTTSNTEPIINIKSPIKPNANLILHSNCTSIPQIKLFQYRKDTNVTNTPGGDKSPRVNTGSSPRNNSDKTYLTITPNAKNGLLSINTSNSNNKSCEALMKNEIMLPLSSEFEAPSNSIFVNMTRKCDIYQSILSKFDLYGSDLQTINKFIQGFNIKYEYQLTNGIFCNISTDVDNNNMKLRLLICILYGELEQLIQTQKSTPKAISIYNDHDDSVYIRNLNDKKLIIDSLLKDKYDLEKKNSELAKNIKEYEYKFMKYRSVIQDTKTILKSITHNLQNQHDKIRNISPDLQHHHYFKTDRSMHNNLQNYGKIGYNSEKKNRYINIDTSILLQDKNHDHKASSFTINTDNNLFKNEEEEQAEREVYTNRVRIYSENVINQGNALEYNKILNKLLNILDNFDTIENKHINQLNHPHNDDDGNGVSSNTNSYISYNTQNKECLLNTSSPEKYSNNYLIAKQKTMIKDLENKNKLVENELSKLNFSNSHLQKIIKEQEKFKENNKLLIEEVKKYQDEKDSLAIEYNKLQENCLKLKEEYNRSLNQFEILIFDKENQINELKLENVNLKNKIESILIKAKEREQKNTEIIAENELELRKSRERNIKLLEDNKNLDVECIKSKQENKDLKEKNYILETKTIDLQSENEMLKATLTTTQNLFKERDDKIQLLINNNQELEKNIIKHKDQEAYFKQVMTQDIEQYEKNLKKINSKAHEVEDENKLLKIKLKDTENLKEGGNTVDVLALEQLAKLLLYKTNEGKDLNQEVRSRFCQIFGSEFTSSLEILSTKLNLLEKEYIELRQKYQNKVWSSISKSDDITWLINLLFKIQENLEQTSLNKQLSMIYDDIIQKRIILDKKLAEIIIDVNSDKAEMKEVLDYNIPNTKNMYNFVQRMNQKFDIDDGSSHHESTGENSDLFNKDLKETLNNTKLLKENELLRSKLLLIQDELNSLKNQNELKAHNNHPNNNMGTLQHTKDTITNKKSHYPPLHHNHHHHNFDNEDTLILLLHTQAHAIEKMIAEHYADESFYHEDNYH